MPQTQNSGQAPRLRLIAQAKQCGFTLAEIHALLTLQSAPFACCDDVRRQVVDKKLHLEARIRAMKAMSKAQDVLIADCGTLDRPVAQCPILNALDRAAEPVA